MITFGMPTDDRLLAAIGRIALRHGQLDYVVKMTIKSVVEVPIREALDATQKAGSAQLRERALKLTKQRLGDGKPYLLLEAVLNRARRASDRRNKLLHSLWAADPEGQHLVREDDHTWSEPPTVEKLDDLAREFEKIIADLNQARLEGYLYEAIVATRKKSR